MITVDMHTPQPEPVINIAMKPETNITFHAGPSEMLKVTEEGFYVRGKKVRANKNEAAAVYKAFKQFLIYHALTRN